MNPSPRSQTRTGLRYAWRMSSSPSSCLNADAALTGSSLTCPKVTWHLLRDQGSMRHNVRLRRESRRGHVAFNPVGRKEHDARCAKDSAAPAGAVNYMRVCRAAGGHSCRWIRNASSTTATRRGGSRTLLETGSYRARFILRDCPGPRRPRRGASGLRRARGHRRAGAAALRRTVHGRRAGSLDPC